MIDPACPYCTGPGGRIVWSSERARIVLIEDSPFAGLCRVVWNGHVKELTDLAEDDRAHLFTVIAAAEQALRDLLQPAKMNLAALGTAMPHLHWHVIPRQSDDSHFPDPIWAAPRRDIPGRKLPQDFPAVLGKVLAEKLGATPAVA